MTHRHGVDQSTKPQPHGPYVTDTYMIMAPEDRLRHFRGNAQFAEWMAEAFPVFEFRFGEWPGRVAAFPCVPEGAPPDLPYPGNDILEAIAARAAAYKPSS